MAKTTLNKANLERLGAEKLADLVLELVQGSAELKRQARYALSAEQGAGEIASDIRKRFAAIRKASSSIDWRKQKALVNELHGLLSMIETKVACTDANEAYELLWTFLNLLPSIYERTDDSNGSIGGTVYTAIELIEKISPSLKIDEKTLAERVFTACQNNGYGQFDGIIGALKEPLGHIGLELLRQLATQWQKAEISKADIEEYKTSFYYSADEAKKAIERMRDGRVRVLLKDIADAQGDVDAYMAQYTHEQLAFGTIAPDVAQRLLAAGRAQEALELLDRSLAEKRASQFRHKIDPVYSDCLKSLGRTDELKQQLLDRFDQFLDAEALRQYLKMLPDFDDMEAEEEALTQAEKYPRLSIALDFFIGWPALDRAAKVVLARSKQLDGNDFYSLPEAANALDQKYPLAATVIWRALIDYTLITVKSKRYRYAARDLAFCAASAAHITDYGDFPTHEDYVKGLREKHGRKTGFWALVDKR